jgi:hypothetical protein
MEWKVEAISGAPAVGRAGFSEVRGIDGCLEG